MSGAFTARTTALRRLPVSVSTGGGGGGGGGGGTPDGAADDDDDPPILSTELCARLGALMRAPSTPTWRLRRSRLFDTPPPAVATAAAAAAAAAVAGRPPRGGSGWMG